MKLIKFILAMAVSLPAVGQIIITPDCKIEASNIPCLTFDLSNRGPYQPVILPYRIYTYTAPKVITTPTTDLFVMVGSDFDRPGLVPRANFNIGIGHEFKFLKRNFAGDEVTFSYIYENVGSHGWFHQDHGAHTEQLGLMRNFPLYKGLTGYNSIQSGVVSYTGNKHLQNRMSTTVSLGGIIHLSLHDSIWFEESYNKVVTIPWYTTSSIGYTFSW